MEINPRAGPSTFRPTPALGVTYLLDTEEQDVRIILPVPLPLPPVDDPNDEDYDPSADQDIDEDELEDDDPEELDGPPYPTPSSIARGKRKATEIYVVEDRDGEESRQSDRLRRKKARLGRRGRKEPEYICISSDSGGDEDDIMEIPKPASPAREKKVKLEREDPPAKPRVAASESKEEGEPDAEPLDESSGSASPDPSPSPEADTGSVERLRPNAPTWLELQLARIRKRYPSAKIEICYHYSIEGDVWKVKCCTCPKTCAVGPGYSLEYMNRHLGGAAHQAAMCRIPEPQARAAPSKRKSNDTQKGKAKVIPQLQAAPRRDLLQAQRHQPATGSGRYYSPAQPATPTGHGRGSGREKEPEMGPGKDGRDEDRDRDRDGDGDDVERFLDQLGLSVALAPKLRSFGFADDKRMSLMGRLSDESLGLLMEHLRKEGVDLVAAIMVREGLKRRAGTL
ncbi:hypothetical protein GSI_05758 [Ganoderma sinense ZZ0214-1]|uniref:Uncharacterized protein n=1 Tax=Ganoderma sinense ZZ0214-1 TaxID=1077348 RepID=A0A2G8SBF0_9APHY|nr:hypothetical protein GSI_05758 [Ganoderma sinense ZZ0214-1]